MSELYPTPTRLALLKTGAGVSAPAPKKVTHSERGRPVSTNVATSPAVTPAEELREAARLMRERAEKATPGPWESLDSGDRLVAWKLSPDGQFDDDFDYVIDEPISNAANAEHIASWHPAVALAVADWLDGVACAIEGGDPDDDIGLGEPTAAFAVARAYLGGAR